MCIQVNNKILSEIELQNQLFEIETINILDSATNQRFQDTTIIIKSKIPRHYHHNYFKTRPSFILYYANAILQEN